MKKINPILLGLSLAVACTFAAAQEPASPPNVLQITREFTKPYRGGAGHDKSESAFVQAMTRAKFPSHYLALNSLSGKSRALFLTQYDSFAAWGRDNDAISKNKALAAEIDHAGLADGELLDSVDSIVYTRDDELSYKPHSDISSARYVEISVFKVRLGHGKEWRELGKLVRDAHNKAGTSAHWAMYEVAYGTEDGTYIAISADKSLADVDTGYAEFKNFREALGEGGWKKLEELYGATVESAHSELFSINPHQSYVPDEWIKADPEFWKPAPVAKEVKKATP